MERRPIVILFNQRHKSGLLLSMDLGISKGHERKVVPPGVKPWASDLSCQHSATEL